MAKTPLPSREEISEALTFVHITDNDGDRLCDIAQAYVEGRLEERESITENMVERMVESRYNARFGGFAWTDPDHVTNGYTRDAFMESARRDLVAALREA